MTRRTAAVVLALWAAAGRHAWAEEIRFLEVPNGSFENGNKDNFPEDWDSDQKDKFSLDTDARFEAKSLHCVVKDKWSYPSISVDLPKLPGGQQVSFGCWLKTKDLEKGDADWKRFTITLKGSLPDGTDWKVDLLTADGTSGWRWHPVTAVNKQPILVPEGLTDAKITIHFEEVGGEAWVDRVTLVEGTALPAETISTSQDVADQTDKVRTAIAKARAAVQDKTLELSPLEAVSDTKEKIRSLDLLADLLEQDAQTLTKVAADRPFAAAKAGEARQAAAQAHATIREATALIDEAERLNLAGPGAKTEADSAAKVHDARAKLEAAVRLIEEVETAASHPLVLAAGWGGDVSRLDLVWEDGAQKEKWVVANTDPLVQPYSQFLVAEPDGTLYRGGTNKEVYRSDDNGRSWSTTPTGLPAKADGLAIDPLNGDRWMLTSWGDGVWWSETEGRAWTRSPSPSPFMRAARAVRVRGAVPRTDWYAIADGTTVVAAREFGGPWSRVASMPRGIKVWDVAPRADLPDRLVAATDAGAAEIAPDGTVTFPKLPASTSDARSLAVIDDRVLVGTAGHGVVDWRPAASGTLLAATLNADLGAVNVSALLLSSHPRPAPPPEELSSQVPRFWTDRNDGLTNLVIGGLAVNPKDEKVVFCTTRGGFFRSADRGGTWTAMNNGLTNIDLGSLVVDPNNPDTLLVAPYPVNKAAGILKSYDGGKNWAQRNTGLQGLGVMSLTMDPNNSSTLFALVWGGGIFQSTDEGENWTQFNNNMPGQRGYVVMRGALPPTTIFAGMDTVGLFRFDLVQMKWLGSSTGLTNLNIWSVAQDPNDAKTWLCGTAGGGLFKSGDGGSTWRQIVKGLTSQNVYTIAYHPKRPGVVYLGTRPIGGGSDRGVFRSTDGGESWVSDSEGLTNLNVHALTISPSGVVFVGTDNGVFYKLD